MSTQMSYSNLSSATLWDVNSDADSYNIQNLCNISAGVL